ncbi:MAG TPA: Na+/H+ antiporter subunit E [Burkholderiales bacterium]|jgi:multicomponent K+:H+ antiporter subunit E|nr:Na+/H+ antiporter subunit E [Burkholderiales bacterium]
MTRWLPFPLVFVLLLAMWLLLNQTLAPGHILFGSVLALCLSWILAVLREDRVVVRHPGVIIRLVVLVAADIVRSNLAVARIIFSPGLRKSPSGFVEIPLELRNPYGLAVLACIITATPGTLWVDFNSATGLLTIHVLDLVDRQAWIDTIKGRYEWRLQEIFG